MPDRKNYTEIINNPNRPNPYEHKPKANSGGESWRESGYGNYGTAKPKHYAEQNKTHNPGKLDYPGYQLMGMDLGPGKLIVSSDLRSASELPKNKQNPQKTRSSKAKLKLKH